MEQQAAMADWSPDGKLTLGSSTQTPHYVHRALAQVLELPPAKIRVIATPNGGGFGGKSDPFNHEIAVAKLAMMTGRPVKVTLTREEVFYCHRGRHPVLMWVKHGVKRDGGITAMHFRSFLDGGAYGSYGVASTFYTGALQTVTYDVPRYKFEGVRCFTNKPPCGPKRGHGTPQPRFALEIQVAKIAEQLGLDPAEMRRPHLIPARPATATFLRIVGMGSSYRGVHMMTGYDALQAAERERELLTLAVAEKLGVPIENITFADRQAFDVENHEVGVSFAEAVQLAESKFGTIGTVGSY